MEHLKKIKELNELRKKGILTDEEFESEKKKILDNQPSPIVSQDPSMIRVNEYQKQDASTTINKSNELINKIEEPQILAKSSSIDGAGNYRNEFQNSEIPQRASSTKKITLIIISLIVSLPILIFALNMNPINSEQEKKMIKFREACERNNGDACFLLGWEYKDLKRFDEAAEFFEIGCNKDIDHSCWEAARIYETKNDLLKRTKFDQRGCVLKNPGSCFKHAQDLVSSGKLHEALARLKESKAYLTESELKGVGHEFDDLADSIQRDVDEISLPKALTDCSIWHGGSSPLCVSEGQRYEEDGNFEVASQFYLKHKEKCTQGACVTGASTGLARLEYKKKNFLKAIELYNNDCKSWHQPSCFMSGLIEIVHNNNREAGEKKLNYWCDVFKLDVCGIFSKSERFTKDSDFLNRLTDELNCSEEVGKIRAKSCLNHGNFLVSNGDSKSANQYFVMACKQGIQDACK